MTKEQRTTILEALSSPGPSPVDAARIARVPMGEFRAAWIRGRSEAEAGQDTDDATFYLSAQENIATTYAALIEEAHIAAGTRESDDLRRLAEHLREHADPFGDVEVAGDVRAQSANLNMTDRIEAEHDPAERERMTGVLQASEQAHYALWQEVLRQEARSRGQG